MAAGGNDSAIGETINLGSGREIAVAALAEVVSAVLGWPDAATAHRPPRPGDVTRLCADTTKAKTTLGFETEIDLREGLERLRDWYLGQGRSAQDLLAEEVEMNWEIADLATSP